MPSLPTRLLLGLDQSTSFLLPLNQHLGGRNTQSTSFAVPMGKQRPREDVICLDNAETLPTSSLPCCLPHQSQTPILDDSVLISFTFTHESLSCGILGDLSVLPFDCSRYSLSPGNPSSEDGRPSCCKDWLVMPVTL